jgi:hypothetical protein
MKGKKWAYREVVKLDIFEKDIKEKNCDGHFLTLGSQNI